MAPSPPSSPPFSHSLPVLLPTPNALFSPLPLSLSVFIATKAYFDVGHLMNNVLGYLFPIFKCLFKFYVFTFGCVGSLLLHGLSLVVARGDYSLVVV